MLNRDSPVDLHEQLASLLRERSARASWPAAPVDQALGQQSRSRPGRSRVSHPEGRGLIVARVGRGFFVEPVDPRCSTPVAKDQAVARRPLHLIHGGASSYSARHWRSSRLRHTGTGRDAFSRARQIGELARSGRPSGWRLLAGRRWAGRLLRPGDVGTHARLARLRQPSVPGARPEARIASSGPARTAPPRGRPRCVVLERWRDPRQSLPGLEAVEPGWSLSRTAGRGTSGSGRVDVRAYRSFWGPVTASLPRARQGG